MSDRDRLVLVGLAGLAGVVLVRIGIAIPAMSWPTSLLAAATLTVIAGWLTFLVMINVRLR